MDYLHSAWRCFWRFCSCLQCTEDLENQGYEPTERAHLLADPINNSPAFGCTSSDNLSHEYSHSLPKKDDQHALFRLVQYTAINMIDAGAMDAQNLEHQEYNDRIKLYSYRLQQQWSSIQHSGKETCGFLKDVANPEQYLSKYPVMDDLTQIKASLARTHIALQDIRIDHKEAIVVPFRIP